MLVLELKLPTLTSPVQVLSMASLETLFRSLAMMGTPEAVHGRAVPTEPLQAQNALQILALLLKLPILTSPVQVLSAETLELLFRSLAMMDTPEAVHGKLPILTSQVQVLSLETPETLFRSLATLDTKEAVHGRAAPTEPLQVQDAANLLVLLLKLPILTRPVKVLSMASLETLFRFLATLDTKVAAHGRAASTETLQELNALL
jgi:hypothetical protein